MNIDSRLLWRVFVQDQDAVTINVASLLLNGTLNGTGMVDAEDEGGKRGNFQGHTRSDC
jgi:hypothetical protein